jgi:hypothetical protein
MIVDIAIIYWGDCEMVFKDGMVMIAKARRDLQRKVWLVNFCSDPLK